MPRLRKLIGIAILGLAVTGCVPAEQYAAVKMRAEQLAEQLAHSQTEIAEANAKADAANRELQAVNNNGSTTSAMVANLESQLAEAQKQSDMWHQKYDDSLGLLRTANAGESPLPKELNNELSAFAAQNPDLVEYDAARGMVKFKSDVTFAVGDATVTGKAREVLGRFASILNAAGEYDLLVAGHTDSTPVTNAKTISKGHFDNWYLSAHRAIAVARELATDGVSSSRMGVVGYADKRPVASNATEAGKQQNRRVEVLILPASSHSIAPGVAAAEPVHHARHKEAAAVPAAAALNKDQPAVTFTK
jgi:chemotaxis protein MotB